MDEGCPRNLKYLPKSVIALPATPIWKYANIYLGPQYLGTCNKNIMQNNLHSWTWWISLREKCREQPQKEDTLWSLKIGEYW